MNKICCSIFSDKNEINDYEVVNFQETLEGLVEKLTNIPNSVLQLICLKTPCITIALDGRVSSELICCN